MSIPEGLVTAIMRKRAVLFVGAGFSASNLLPSWRSLLDKLIEEGLTSRVINLEEQDELRRALDEGKLQFVAEKIRKELRVTGRYDRALDNMLRPQLLVPAKRYRLITEIPFSAVLTTNYDKLIETAYAQRGATPPVFTHDQADEIIDSLYEENFFILKAHGDIDRKTTIILSEGDYRDLVYGRRGYTAAIDTIFITKTVLFIGTSLADPDIRMILERVRETFNNKAPIHYVLLPETRMGRLERRHWAEYYGIEVLPYTETGGHPEVETFLQELNRRIRTPRDSGERVMETKWYPADDVMYRITSSINSGRGRCFASMGFPKKPETLREVNILFDTRHGDLHRISLNLSIKLIARMNETKYRYSAFWKMIDLATIGNQLDRIWERTDLGEGPEHLGIEEPSRGVQTDIREVLKNLRMPQPITDFLRRLPIEPEDLKPAVIICVKREVWRPARESSMRLRLTLHVSRVSIFPFTEYWIGKLPRNYGKLLSYRGQPSWKWNELEIEGRGAKIDFKRDEFFSQLGSFEGQYQLSSMRSQFGPISKYHNAVTILRDYSKSNEAREDEQSLEDWAPYLRVGTGDA